MYFPDAIFSEQPVHGLTVGTPVRVFVMTPSGVKKK